MTTSGRRPRSGERREHIRRIRHQTHRAGGAGGQRLVTQGERLVDRVRLVLEIARGESTIDSLLVYLDDERNARPGT